MMPYVLNQFYYLLCRADARTLLLAHRMQILSDDDETDVKRITIRRRHILKDTMKYLRHTPWQSSQHLRVIFIGEPGIDDGGPRREFFRLLLTEVGNNNNFFYGPPNRRVPNHNVLNLQNTSFFYLGQIIGLSLLHDGPCIQCLAPTTVQYILGSEEMPAIDDIPDIDIQKKMKSVS